MARLKIEAIKMKKTHIAFLLFIFSITAFSAKAQFFTENSSTDSSSRPINQKIGLLFQSTAFFKNNEYFHPLIEGYTLPGFQLQPRLYYEANEKFTLEAGVHFSQFSGTKGLKSIEPLFRASWKATPNFSVVLGWLNGTTSHKLIEPLYQWERLYTHPLEYGAQFLVDRPGFKLDTWIDWERYIELNDPFQEELTFGLNSKILLLKPGNWEFWLPIQSTIKHQGGQITSVDEPLKTLANFGSGLNVAYNAQGVFLKRLLVDIYMVGYSDLSPQKKQPFKNGYGIYPSVTAEMGLLRASLGYFRAHQFISSKGEPLLLCVSTTNPSLSIPDRYVVTGKLSFYKRIFENISFGAYAETYYDTHRSKVDYDYGISLSVSGDILFRKF